MKRIVVAFLLAPLPAAFFQSVVVAIWPKEGRGVFEHPLSMFVAMCLVFYLLQLILGVPLYVAARRRLPQRWPIYGALGAAMTLLPVVAGLVLSESGRGLPAYAIGYSLAFFGIGGFFAGITFWCLAARPQ